MSDQQNFIAQMGQSVKQMEQELPEAPTETQFTKRINEILTKLGAWKVFHISMLRDGQVFYSPISPDDFKNWLSGEQDTPIGLKRDQVFLAETIYDYKDKGIVATNLELDMQATYLTLVHDADTSVADIIAVMKRNTYNEQS